MGYMSINFMRKINVAVVVMSRYFLNQHIIHEAIFNEHVFSGTR